MMIILIIFTLYIGTHNEKSTLHALETFELKGISNNNRFGLVNFLE